MTTDPTAALKLARDALSAIVGSTVRPTTPSDGAALNAARAAIAAIDALPAPSGEPTADQKRAGARAWMEAIADPDMSPTDKAAHVYRAMLGALPAQAAPAPQASGEPAGYEYRCCMT